MSHIRRFFDVVQFASGICNIPIVTVTGPRQSGKTTLCRAAFPHLDYVNLEAPDQREFAESDPRGFLARLGPGAILDEIQRVPDLLSYLRVVADEAGRNSLFVLTGSEQFRLSDVISQALGDYFETYVERGVRRIGEIRNLASFRRFVRLCAERVGQLANLSSLGADAGVSHTTASHWLTVLEASYVVFRLPPFHANIRKIRKRLVKTPKLYFYDVGLASHLIGIEHAGQIGTHPLRGPLFENAVVVEVLKHRFNRGRRSDLTFFRDSRGLECDLLYENGNGMGAIEIKSGATVASDWFDSFDRVAKELPEIVTRAVVYGGAERQSWRDGEVVPLTRLNEILERMENRKQA